MPYWKKASRTVLHNMGGLSALRLLHREKFRVLMFHAFPEGDNANVEAICAEVARRYEPVSLSQLSEGLRDPKKLPANAVALTVDDGYRDYLLHGHPILRRYGISATVYAVSAFANGDLWLWPHHVEYAFENTPKTEVEAAVAGQPAMQLDCSSPTERRRSAARLSEVLKSVPNDVRRGFLTSLPVVFDVEIPPQPPPARAAMTWDELRAIAADGAEVGCHTHTHPILSRIPLAELDLEIRGAKEILEQHLKFPIRHFCYPNGRPQDVSDAVVDHVREAGFWTATTCSYGLNSVADCDPLRLKRIPLDSSCDPHYASELMAGLHM